MESMLYIGCLLIVFPMGVSASLLFKLIGVFTTNSRLNLHKTSVEKKIQKLMLNQFSNFFISCSIGFFTFLTFIYLRPTNFIVLIPLLLLTGFLYMVSIIHLIEGLRIRFLYKQHGNAFLNTYKNILLSKRYYAHGCVAAIYYSGFYLLYKDINLLMIIAAHIHLVYLFCLGLKYVSTQYMTERIIACVIIISSISIIVMTLFIPVIGYSYYYLLVIGTQASNFFVWSGVLLLLIMSDNAYIHYQNSVKDSLTGIYNRRFFTLKLKETIKVNELKKNFTSLIIFDIDDFKRINDDYGHDIGDLAIQHFVKIVATKLRKNDVMARIGGEEFAAILPNTDIAEAQLIADRLCQSIKYQPLIIDNNITLQITGSFGVSCSKNSTDNCLFKDADTAMYQSKNNGKDKVTVYSKST